MTLEKCNHRGGWAVKVLHVQKDGHYHHVAKITIIFAIGLRDPNLPLNACGSVECPKHCIQCRRTMGTNSKKFHDFCDHVCRNIETNNIPGTDLHRIFVWDNSATHLSAATNHVGPSHSLSSTATLPSKNGLITYKIFYLMERILIKKEEHWDVIHLEQEITIAENQIEIIQFNISALCS